MKATRPIGPAGDDIRSRLARAAFELFRNKGYSSTTVDDIVLHAEVSRRTFFRYYRSKEAVIFPDHDQLLETVRTRMELIPDEPAIEAICQAVRLVLEHYVDTREVSLERYRLVGQVPSFRERELVSVAAYQRLFREHVERELTDEPDAALRAELIASSVATAHNHVLREWLRGGGSSDPYPELEAALRQVRNLYNNSTPRAAGGDSGRGQVTLLVAAFDELTTNEAITSEIQRIRRAAKTSSQKKQAPEPKSARGGR